MKTCTKCRTTKDSTDFSRGQAHCKACRNAYRKSVYDPERSRMYNLRRNYGLTIDQYNEMLEAQDHRCAICRIHVSELRPHKGQPGFLGVDHSHRTGKVRGLLCELCNRYVGRHRDDLTIARATVAYLERHAPETA